MKNVTLLRTLSLPLLIIISHLHLSAQQPVAISNSEADVPGRLSFWDFASTSSPWYASSVAPGSFLNNVVHAVGHGNGDTYVGGDFTSIGDNPISFLARWDGAAWHPLGDVQNGVDGPVLSILVDGDNVYVGGNFTRAGSVRTRNIAVWNRATNRWSGFGGGVGGTLRNGVTCMAIHDGQLYVAGSFIAAGNIVAANIARWDGRKWHRVGTGINNTVQALHIEGDYLYAGGDFTVAGDIRTAGIARYNLVTEQWEKAALEIEGSVRAIASDDRYLYIGGVFDSVEGRRANNILRLEKATDEWSPMHKGLTGYNYIAGGVGIIKGVESILIQGSDVYVGGTLTETYTQRTSGEYLIYLAGFAKWNGEYWSNLAFVSNPEVPNGYPPGVRKNLVSPPNIYALAQGADGTIFIGGDFYGVSIPGGGTPYFCKFSPGDSSFSGVTLGTAKKDNGPEIQSVVGMPGRIDEPNTLARHGRYDIPLRAASLFNADTSGLYQETATGSLSQWPEDIYWEGVEAYIANNHGVLAVAADNDEIYAGGTFTHLYGLEANGIAVRKNESKEWTTLDDGSALGVDGYVYAIAIKGSKVYVGGQFSKAGGIEAENIAVWDRTTRTWSALGDGVTGSGDRPPFVSAIVIQGNDIYVAGNFTTAGASPANNIARWNGSSWTPLGTGIDGTVNALKFFQNNLYAGGSFTRAGGVVSNSIAYWDGERWNGMDGGLSGFVNDIEIYATAGETTLVVGGEFSREMLPGSYARNLIWWTGSEWYIKGSKAVVEGPFVTINGEVRDLMMVGASLYVAGAFTDAIPRGTGSASSLLWNVAFFDEWIWIDGTAVPMWHTLAGGLRGNVNALAISGDEIVAGGDFTRLVKDNYYADHVALWSLPKQKWLWAGNPTALAPLEALEMHNNTLYATGSFVSQEPGLFDIINYVVKLTPLGWRTVEGEIRGTGYSLASVSGDEMVMGGAMISSDGLIAVNVSRWNSATADWKPLTPGSGVASLEDISFVSAVASYGDNVYVGGSFDIADTMSVRNVACWNRRTNTWSRLGNGLNGMVTALAVDVDGKLYAGGSFTKSGNRDVSHVAWWDGTNWQPLGDGVDDAVFALLPIDGALYAGGKFRNAGSVSAVSVARWDIAAGVWSSLGAGLDAEFVPSVYSLAVSRGRLFAAGKFEVSGSDSIHNIARWNPGGSWDRLGSGTDRLITALAISETGTVYAGGHFLTAGAKDLQYVAQWQDPTLSVENESDVSSGTMLSVGTPNPFTTTAHIRLTLPEGDRRQVMLTLFDPAGRRIATLHDGPLPSGSHTLSIDGEALASGIYFLQLESEGKIESVKLVKQ